MQFDFSAFENDEIGVDFDSFDINEELKLFNDYEPRPVDILIRLYIPPKKTKGGIIMDNSRAIYNEITGYVAKIGKCCFTGERYKEWGNWYKEGEWIVFPRHAGTRFTYKNLPVFSIVDDAPIAIIKDPRGVR